MNQHYTGKEMDEILKRHKDYDGGMYAVGMMIAAGVSAVFTLGIVIVCKLMGWL